MGGPALGSDRHPAPLRPSAMRTWPIPTQPTWESVWLSIRLMQVRERPRVRYDSREGTDHRPIKMRTYSSLRDLSRANAPELTRRVSGVANCITRLDDFRTWPHAVPVAILGTIRSHEHLRPKSRPTDTAQSCPNRNNSLRELEIGETQEKNRQTDLSAGGFHRFPGKTNRYRWVA